MSAQKALLEIRDLLVEKRHQRDGRENRASTKEIIQEFEKENPDVIKRARPSLVTMSLTALFHEGQRRKPESIDPVQTSFLSTFGVPDCIYVPSKKSGKLKPQHPMDSTLPEILAYSERLPAPSSGVTNKDKFRLLVDRLKPFQIKEGMTAGQCWKVMQKAEGKDEEAGGEDPT